MNTLNLEMIAAIVIGCLCMAFGISIIILTYFYPHVLKANAPNLIVAIFGAMFFLAAIAVINNHFISGGVKPDSSLVTTPPTLPILISHILGASILASMTIGFSWIAFGGGERTFTSVSSTRTGEITKVSGAFSGRITFAVASLFLFLFFLSSFYQVIKTIKERFM